MTIGAFQPYFPPIHEILAGTAAYDVPAQTIKTVKYDSTFHCAHFSRRLGDHAIQAISDPILPATVLGHS